MAVAETVEINAKVILIKEIVVTMGIMFARVVMEMDKDVTEMAI
jgi:hypothetical protein